MLTRSRIKQGEDLQGGRPPRDQPADSEVQDGQIRDLDLFRGFMRPRRTPHAFSVNIMTQGGASGSPVFSSETGGVLGVLYGGLRDFGVTLKTKEPHWIPTNISYVVPSHYLKEFLERAEKDPDMRSNVGAKTIDQMLAEKKLVNAYEYGWKWTNRQVDPQAEAERVRNVVRVPFKPTRDGNGD